LREGVCRVAHHPLVVRKLAFEVERIIPAKRRIMHAGDVLIVETNSRCGHARFPSAQFRVSAGSEAKQRQLSLPTYDERILIEIKAMASSDCTQHVW
jgi:hypothetical protein